VSPPRETQPERTALAWQRTGLGMMTVAVLLAHGALRSREEGMYLASGAAALLALLVLGGLAPVRYRQVRRTVHDEGGTRSAVAPVVAATATGAVALVALAALTAPLLLR
jgi:putative membrane protein